MRTFIYIIIVILSYQYGKSWEKADTERKASEYIDNGKCTEAQQEALEVVIFKEVQR